MNSTPDTFTFPSQVDEAPIFVRKWSPPCGVRPRAAVQITHGIAEHSGRYDRLARYLAATGCVAYALDLRGHGHTAGPEHLGQGGVDVWDHMTSDLRQLAELARAENPGLPLVAFGHSMGSALTQAHIEKHGDLLAGAVLCGTLGAIPGLGEDQYKTAIAQLHELATGPDAASPSQFFGGILMQFNAPFTAGVAHPTGCEWQTSDPEEIQKFISDPLCGKPFSNSMTYSVIKGFHDLWVPDNESRVPLDLPILIVAGTDDPVGGKTTTIQGLITRYLGHGHLELQYRFYAGGRHEIFNEPEKDQVHREIGHWLSAVVDR
ncbi:MULTISPECIES: alpha/beta fold hydrolase [unclassified Mycolicibacterium]|uniref:alpha/beta fold hydrolase n=1 Tax=unclassified Mycolicibacterium TaxID=2636767 RepID=UPI0012DD2098|nr:MULTISPECIES: alpha/beta fold hydrolase [unclassified Mycolicibacterium]MUL80237.1 lysophospholipase [Mycolicibacterium sp. CBMA 329]MUL86004.1 lysophospholipase [Mycolicibacterium sp. CBMA 331]MUM00778.1 lysophospholipase [Mycolicibacterium sp. CBMA 334]MUM28201.1 lysophospholipase [Mycolicibacterium sp. CBMA 295]MUM36300.1 lysophospholipase [Mycolicibacterium sp. CBMA 247]